MQPGHGRLLMLVALTLPVLTTGRSIVQPADIAPAISLAKFAYSLNPHNIPREVLTAGRPASMQRPLMADDRLGIYVFQEAGDARRVWMVFRGMMLASAWASGSWMLPELLLVTTTFEGSVHDFLPPGMYNDSDIGALANATLESSEGSWWSPQRELGRVQFEDYVLGVAVLMHRMMAQVQPSEIVFVGHSYGGSVGALLAAAYRQAAIVFNSPGTRVAAQRWCAVLQNTPHSAQQEAVSELRSRVCSAPSRETQVFNFYFEADPLPAILDYPSSTDWKACPILLSGVSGKLVRIQDQISTLRLFGLLSINFPEGLSLCPRFHQARSFYELLSWSFAECFGAAHHVQVTYKMITGMGVQPEEFFQSCRPVAHQPAASTDWLPEWFRAREPRGHPEQAKEINLEELPGDSCLDVWWRGQLLGNLWSDLFGVLRAIRYTYPLWGLVLIYLSASKSRMNQRWKWRNAIRTDRVSFILANVAPAVTDGWHVTVRNIKETSTQQLFFNEAYAMDLVRNAAKATKIDAPLLKIPNPDYWPIKNCIVSSLQQQFSEGFLMHDMGLPVHAEWYVFGISCVATKDASHKIRVVLTKESTLREIVPRVQMDKLTPDSPSRRNTVLVLKAMWDAYENWSHVPTNQQDTGLKRTGSFGQRLMDKLSWSRRSQPAEARLGPVELYRLQLFVPLIAREHSRYLGMEGWSSNRATLGGDFADDDDHTPAGDEIHRCVECMQNRNQHS